MDRTSEIEAVFRQIAEPLALVPRESHAAR
jgi:hypothetical protein